MGMLCELVSATWGGPPLLGAVTAADALVGLCGPPPHIH
jgi:hypothetical protein